MAKKDARDTAKFVKVKPKKEARRPSGRTPETKGKNTDEMKKALLGAAKRVNSDIKNYADVTHDKPKGKADKAITDLLNKRKKIK